MIAAILIASLSFFPSQQGGTAKPGTRLLVFRADAVDGVDDLVLDGGGPRIEHLEFDPILGTEMAVEEPLPPGDVRVVVRKRTGRPRVTVVQQPSDENGRSVRVRIDDGPASGAAPLSFELWALPAPSVPHPIDVIVITIDSLRPDHLGCYGYARPTSPNLDAFAKAAVRYESAFSSSSFTPPSHATLLTSRHVGDHGLLTWNPLPEEQLTLAEILSAHGYRTGASVNLDLLSGENLGQGVEWQREGDRDARRIVDDALEFLRDEDPRPVFLWLHLYDVHRPYGRVRGWANRFGDAPRPGIGDGEDHYNLEAKDVEERRLAYGDLRHVADRYDAGIAYADAELAPLLAEISRPERLARTLVVITADHGESLLDHGERLFTHDPFLYAAVTRIPMLVRYPARTPRPPGIADQAAGVARMELTGLIDIAPTVLAEIGIAPPPTFQGRSLRALEEGRPWPEREIYHECWGWSRLAAARTHSWLALLDVEAGRTRVFDLARDPGERAPLDPGTNPEAEALAKKLEAFSRRIAPMGDPALDPELKKRLEALGYTDR